MGNYAKDCPTKRTLVFHEDLNGWVEEEEELIDEDLEDGN